MKVQPVDIESALSFLAAHQPLPPDDALSEAEIDTFEAIREYFLHHPDERCIKPLLNAFGDGSGFGVYQLVEDVIVQFPKDAVLPVLLRTIESPYTGVRFWSIQMSPEFSDEQLIQPLVRNLHHDRPEIRGAAADSLALIGDSKLIPRLESILSNEKDVSARKALSEAISDIANRD